MTRSSQAHLKLFENDIMSVFPNFFVLTDVRCLSSDIALFKNRYYVPLNSTNHMGMGLFLSLAAYNLSFFFFFSETKIFPGIVPKNNTEKKVSCESYSRSNANSTALPFYRATSP